MRIYKQYAGYMDVGNNVKMVTAKNINTKTQYWAIAGLIISWATFWIFLFSPFGLICWICILVYLLIKKSHLKWYIIFSAWIFVPSCNFLIGSVRYFTGTASLKGVGGPETYHGIDRETRVKSTSSGCIFVGYKPFVFQANNAAIRLLTNLFGYQKGAYTGTYPTEQEAKEIIKVADTVNVIKIDDYYEFLTKDISVRLDTLELYRYHHRRESLVKVIGKTVGKDCFVFQQFASNEDTGNAVYIVDTKNMRLLTQYFDYY